MLTAVCSWTACEPSHRESEIDRSEWLPYGLAQLEKSPNPEFPLACVTPCLSRILHKSLLEGE